MKCVVFKRTQIPVEHLLKSLLRLYARNSSKSMKHTLCPVHLFHTSYGFRNSETKKVRTHQSCYAVRRLPFLTFFIVVSVLLFLEKWERLSKHYVFSIPLTLLYRKTWINKFLGFVPFMNNKNSNFLYFLCEFLLFISSLLLPKLAVHSCDRIEYQKVSSTDRDLRFQLPPRRTVL
jgi:hypothetical protein